MKSPPPPPPPPPTPLIRQLVVRASVFAHLDLSFTHVTKLLIRQMSVLGIYLCVVMTMTSASVMVAVIVINIYNRGMKMRRAPAWFRKLTLEWMSKVLHLEHDIELVAQSVVLVSTMTSFIFAAQKRLPGM